MPAMANITVADSVPVNHTFNNVNASAGDKVPAVWRENAAHANIGFRPRFSVVMRDNAAGNGRAFTMAFNVPFISTDPGGNDFIAARFPLQLTGVIPTNVSSADLNNWYYVASNLFASTLVRSCVEEASSPT